MLSNNNNRITMEIVLVKNRALDQTLVATRSENSKEITRLVEEIESRCESEEERKSGCGKGRESHTWKATSELSICWSMKMNKTRRKGHGQ